MGVVPAQAGTVTHGFGWYLLLLLILLLSGSMLGEHAPGTLPNESGIGRYLAWGLRLANYASAGIILLFVGNMTEEELPTTRVLRWLSALFATTAIGGLAGLLLPPVQIPTPARYLLPGALTDNGFVKQLVTVTFAQWQTVLGDAAPRPSAPFVYTNTWGNMLSLLLPYFIVGAVLWTRGKRRHLAIGLLVLTVPAVIYSLQPWAVARPARRRGIPAVPAGPPGKPAGGAGGGSDGRRGRPRGGHHAAVRSDPRPGRQPSLQ